MSNAELERLIDEISTKRDASGIELGVPPDAESASATDGTIADVRDRAAQPRVMGLANLFVREAVEEGASDVHLETGRDGRLVVRFRLDGVLIEAMPPVPAAFTDAVISRIKLLANLDIAERRRPQDGRIRARLESRELDLRVSTVPTLHGESVVLRLLDRGGRPAALESLGLTADLLQRLVRLCLAAHGMIIVTAPTGSGKTTTQYAMLVRRDVKGEKILTVEDPIEYELEGVTQVPVHRQTGVTMESVLRSFLRQDPDVIMVGEMRDAETAAIAIQAAMTGHLVFSTLHTTDAVGAVPRLLDLGVADYLIAGTLQGVLAQRLVRQICDGCRIEYAPAREHLQAMGGESALNGTRLTRGAGCPACRNTGYRGRTGLFELLMVTEEIKDAIVRRARRSELMAIAIEQGMVPLRANGWAKVAAGVTTVEEVLRVTTD